MDDCRGLARVRRTVALVLLAAALPELCWSQSSGLWSRLELPVGQAPGLTPRTGHSVVYDPLRHRMLVYGGHMGTRAQIMALDLRPGGTWASIPVVGGPSTSATAMSVVYDSRRDRLIVFGGTDSQGFTNNQVLTLALTGPSSWTGPALSVRPSARVGHAAVYDPIGDRMIVFGGFNSSTGFLNDVWQLTLSGTPSWTQLAPSGPSPSPRTGTGAVYDPLSQRMLFFGGNIGGTPDDAIWSLSLGA